MKNLPIYYDKCPQVFMQSICYFFQIFMKLAMTRQIFEK